MRLQRASILGSFSLSPRWLTARRLAAAVLAAGALLLAVTPPPPPATTAIAQSQTDVLVAAHDLAAGLTLGPDDLLPAPRASAQLPDGAISADAEVAGRVITGAVRRGEIITDRRLLGPGVSAGLGSGVVASPVRLVDLGVAALLRPGDRVDILAASADTETAVVVAAGVLVLAVPRAESGDAAVVEPLGLVVVAVSAESASRLAAAAASSSLTATILPP